MADARAKQLRRLRRLRRSARKWSVCAGASLGATAVLVPYHGLGLPDAVWAATAGGSLAIAAWRWLDLRALSARPLPPPTTPELAAAEARQRLTNVVLRLPAGNIVLGEARRRWTMFQMRGMPVADLWRRLDQASTTLASLRGRLAGPAATVVTEATTAEPVLRDLADRSIGVERVKRTVTGVQAQVLDEANSTLLNQLTDGVGAYERLVAAAATYVAEDTQITGKNPAIDSLAEAADLLRCIADSMSELRRADPA